MRLGMIAVCLLLSPAARVPGADYVSERKAAAELLSAGQPAEALAQFLALAESAASPVQKTDALEQAVVCAIQLKQLDRAGELAQQIPLRPYAKAARLQVLEAGREWQALADEFGAEEIAAWPERLLGDAYLRRGGAFVALKQGEPAARDFAAAVGYLTGANSQGFCLNQLGDVYLQLLSDEEQALDAYRRSMEVGTVYKQCQAAIQIAGILSGRDDPRAALAELERVDLEELTAPYWRGKLLCTQGRVLLRAGRKPEADARLALALEIKDLPDEIRRECESLRRAAQ